MIAGLYLDHVLELREHMFAHITWLVIKPQRVVPLVEGIVDAHAQALAADGIGEVAK
jgi:hypothetical protein